MSEPGKPYVVPSTARRDIAIGVGAAVVVIVLVLFAFVHFSGKQRAGWLKGEIVEKFVEKRNEELLVVSRKGAKRLDVDGEYYFRVRVPRRQDELYDVNIDPRVYKVKKVGEEFEFPEPK